MLSAEAEAVIAELRAQPVKLERDPPKDRAEWIERALADPPPAGTAIVAESHGGVGCERVTAEGAEGGGLVLLLHGGGYVAGCPITHRKMAAQISAATGVPVLVPDYRLAPENPFPAGLDDALSVARAVGTGPGMAVVGDSAGGGLAVALCLALRDAGEALPAAAVLFSPWTDILAQGESYAGNAIADPSMNAERLRDAGRLYVGDGDPLNPLVSPVRANLAGLPPMLIQVGGAEMMLDDSTIFAERLRDAGGAAECEVWDGLWHVFQNHAPRVPEAVEAIARAGTFLQRHLR
jgi:monoterpene epsilon-lactone hydrolase